MGERIISLKWLLIKKSVFHKSYKVGLYRIFLDERKLQEEVYIQYEEV